MTKYLSEIFEEISMAKTKEEKISILRKYASPVVKQILKYAFDKTEEFYLNKDNMPNWNPDKGQLGMSPSNLYNEFRRMYLFKKDKIEKYTQETKNRLIISLLESLHPKEAYIVVNIFDGKVKGLTPEIALEAFPGLFELDDDKKNKTDKTKKMDINPVKDPPAIFELTDDSCDAKADELDILARMNGINPDEIETWKEVAEQLIALSDVVITDASVEVIDFAGKLGLSIKGE